MHVFWGENLEQCSRTRILILVSAALGWNSGSAPEFMLPTMKAQIHENWDVTHDYFDRIFSRHHTFGETKSIWRRLTQWYTGGSCKIFTSLSLEKMRSRIGALMISGLTRPLVYPPPHIMLLPLTCHPPQIQNATPLLSSDQHIDKYDSIPKQT